jgi:hypothetical protein
MASFSLTSNTAEGHFVSRNVLSGIGQIRVQMLLSPIDSGSLHGLTVREQSLSSLSADYTAQRGSSSTFSVTLSHIKLTSKPWQLAHCSSKIPFPILVSPAGTTTSGSFTYFFFFPAIVKIKL